MSDSSPGLGKPRGCKCLEPHWSETEGFNMATADGQGRKLDHAGNASRSKSTRRNGSWSRPAGPSSAAEASSRSDQRAALADTETKSDGIGRIRIVEFYRGQLRMSSRNTPTAEGQDGESDTNVAIGGRCTRVCSSRFSLRPFIPVPHVRTQHRLHKALSPQPPLNRLGREALGTGAVAGVDRQCQARRGWPCPALPALPRRTALLPWHLPHDMSYSLCDGLGVVALA